MTLSTLSNASDKALDPVGMLAGTPTLKVTSLVVVSLPVILKSFSVAARPSTALIVYVVLSFGVVNVPPRSTVVPLIVMPLFTKALLGRFVKVFSDPERTQVSNVLFVTV